MSGTPQSNSGRFTPLDGGGAGVFCTTSIDDCIGLAAKLVQQASLSGGSQVSFGENVAPNGGAQAGGAHLDQNIAAMTASRNAEAARPRA